MGKKKHYRLTVIIPYWNAEPYTSELLACLDKQMRSEIEVIVVDDGSTVPFKTDFKWCKVIRKSNGGVSTARNIGLDNAKGDYVQFIDADDLVPEYFFERLMAEFKACPDVIEFTWRSLDGKFKRKAKENELLANPSVCTRCFKRSFIGDVRFNEKKDSTEDEDFSRKIGYVDPNKDFNRAFIDEYMYFYRMEVTDSKVKRFKKGLMNTKRIIYHYDHVTSDMTDVFEQIKKDDEENEVILITNKCDIPEIKRYCKIAQCKKLWGHYLKGEAWEGYEQIPVPIKTQVVIYCEYTNIVGGIPSFIYNFCQNMKDYYDILFLYDRIDPIQTNRIKKVVRTMKNIGQKIACDTLILNRLTDKVPPNVYAKKTVQVCHCCKQKSLDIPKDRDVLINVSQVAKDSWEDQAKNGIVINNMPYTDDSKMVMLVSACRVGAVDKGGNDERMRKLAQLLEDAKINYIWLNFSDNPLLDMPSRFINMGTTLDVQAYIRKADYYVLLSDQEACSMGILEALTNSTAVLATPFPSLFEQGFLDGKTGYIVPFDMNFDVKKILNVPQFGFHFDTERRIYQWREVLGKTTPKKDYVPDDTVITDEIDVKVLRMYWDEQLNRHVYKNEVLKMRPKRAEFLMEQKRIAIL